MSTASGTTSYREKVNSLRASLESLESSTGAKNRVSSMVVAAIVVPIVALLSLLAIRPKFTMREGEDGEQKRSTAGLLVGTLGISIVLLGLFYALLQNGEMAAKFGYIYL